MNKNKKKKLRKRISWIISTSIKIKFRYNRKKGVHTQVGDKAITTVKG